MEVQKFLTYSDLYQWPANFLHDFMILLIEIKQNMQVNTYSTPLLPAQLSYYPLRRNSFYMWVQAQSKIWKHDQYNITSEDSL